MKPSEFWIAAFAIVMIGISPGWLERTVAADDSEEFCLAQAMYWEARGGGRDAMIAVGWVALNRKNDDRFPDHLCRVVHQGGEDPPCQFSYWCDGKRDTPENEQKWKLAQDLAARMLKDPPKDPTGGALYYHSVDIPEPWGKPRRRTAQIGDHLFYR